MPEMSLLLFALYESQEGVAKTLITAGANLDYVVKVGTSSCGVPFEESIFGSVDLWHLIINIARMLLFIFTGAFKEWFKSEIGGLLSQYT